MRIERCRTSVRRPAKRVDRNGALDSGQSKIPVGGHFISLPRTADLPFHGHRAGRVGPKVKVPSGATLEVSDHARAAATGGTVKKSDREIMEILEAFDATGCAHSAAALAGVDPKTVRRYVAKPDAGGPVDEPVRRPRLIDPFLPKIEELVETSGSRVTGQ